MVLDTRLSDQPIVLDNMRAFMSRSVYFAKFRRRDFLRFAAQFNNCRGMHLHHDTDELQSQSSGHGSLPHNENFSLFQVHFTYYFLGSYGGLINVYILGLCPNDLTSNHINPGWDSSALCE